MMEKDEVIRVIKMHEDAIGAVLGAIRNEIGAAKVLYTGRIECTGREVTHHTSLQYVSTPVVVMKLELELGMTLE
jgi:hypothetical protein